MRILHVVRQFHPSQGGLETYVSELVIHQKNQGNDVEILTLDRIFGTDQALREADDYQGVPVKRVAFWGSRQCFLPFINPFYLNRFDVIHVHALDQTTDMIACYSLLLPLKPKTFFTSHGLFFHTKSLETIKNIYFQTISRFTLSRMRHLFAVSRNDADQMKKIGCKAEIMFNPIVPFKSKGVGQDFLYLGRIALNKNIGQLLEFYSLLKKTNEHAGKLHIVGTDGDNLLPAILKRFKQLEVAENIIIHGSIQREQIEEVIKNCRYIISSSTYEGYGIAMVEGMSAGLLPVMQENAAFKEIKNRSYVGFVGDFFDAAQVVQDFIAWEQTITPDMVQKAIDFADKNKWDDIHERIGNHYQHAFYPTERTHAIRYLAGLPVSIETKQSALEAIKNRIISLEQQENLRVTFANTNLSVQMHQHPKRQELLACLNLFLNDGVGTDLASLYVSGKKFVNNLNGTDFVPSLLESLPQGTKISLYGSTHSVVAKLSHKLETQYGLDVVSQRGGYDGITDAYLQELRDTKPQLFLVAQGNPLQEETIMALHQAGIDIPVMMGVGALFGFMTDSIKRAPDMVRSLRLEWLYRLVLEPKRLWKRYSIDIFKYFWLVYSYHQDRQE